MRPNDDLPDWKSCNDLSAVLKQSILDSPFVIIENDSPFWVDNSHHLGQTSSLPVNVLTVVHFIFVFVIALQERSILPFPSIPIVHAPARTLAEVIRRRGDDPTDTAVRNLFHDIEAVALMDGLGKASKIKHRTGRGIDIDSP